MKFHVRSKMPEEDMDAEEVQNVFRFFAMTPDVAYYKSMNGYVHYIMGFEPDFNFSENWIVDKTN